MGHGEGKVSWLNMSGLPVQGVHALESETKGGKSRMRLHDGKRQLGRLVVYTWRAMGMS